MQSQQPYWHAQTVEEVERALDTCGQGLTDEQAAQRPQSAGRNELQTGGGRSLWSMLTEQFKDFMILVLLVAALVSGLLGEWTDTFIILAIVILNAILGVAQQAKAEKSLQSLKSLSAPVATVLRGGHHQRVEAAALVPGDVVLLEAGSVVPADLRLFQTAVLKAQEAALTGESAPVDKDAAAMLAQDAALGDRLNMAYSSSTVTYGRGAGIVVATGMRTQVGQIAGMLTNQKESATPLQRKLNQAGKMLGLAAIAICALVFVIGLLRGQPLVTMFLTSVSLAVAAMPEGLPAIATIVLALGVQRMVRRNAIIRTLPSVETLGSATVICSDKTGTLTQSRMTVTHWYTQGDVRTLAPADVNDPGCKMLATAAILCNDAHIQSGMAIGDPTETALLDMGEILGVEKRALEQTHPRVSELPFDSQRKRMTTLHRHGETYQLMTKGGVVEVLRICTHRWTPEGIIDLTDEDREQIAQANVLLAAQALRVLAYATRETNAPPAPGQEERMEHALAFIGLTGMIDPPRPEAIQAVALCRQAGIRPVMITGDHKQTAVAIATQMGIYSPGDTAVTGQDVQDMTDEQLFENVRGISVYARVSPEHKLRIVDAWQKQGEIVAMTGDGVNDAPAIKRADIGAAMGIVGTDVSKEAADMVLTDDNFATIVSAVEEGRRIYDNINKAIQFLLSCNIGEVLCVFVATLIGWGEPLLPIHLLWVNLVTDSLPALALGVDPAQGDLMARAPVRNRSLFTRGMIWRILYQGAMVGLLTLAAYRIGLRESTAAGQTMALCVLAFTQLFHVFNVRSRTKSAFTRQKHNLYLFGASLLSMALTLALLLIPPAAQAFKLAALGGAQWLWVAGLSVAPIAIVELFKMLRLNAFKDEA